MPRANFVFMARGINVSGMMPTPKRIQNPDAWYRGARARLKELPALGALPHNWFIFTWDADIRWIRFNLRNSVGETAQLVIDRSRKSFG